MIVPPRFATIISAATGFDVKSYLNHLIISITDYVNQYDVPLVRSPSGCKTTHIYHQITWFPQYRSNKSRVPGSKSLQNLFVFDRIVRKEGCGTDLRYKICWYKYSEKHDTLGPATHISQQFIHHCWKGKPAYIFNKRTYRLSRQDQWYWPLHFLNLFKVLLLWMHG